MPPPFRRCPARAHRREIPGGLAPMEGYQTRRSARKTQAPPRQHPIPCRPSRHPPAWERQSQRRRPAAVPQQSPRALQAPDVRGCRPVASPHLHCQKPTPQEAETRKGRQTRRTGQATHPRRSAPGVPAARDREDGEVAPWRPAACLATRGAVDGTWRKPARIPVLERAPCSVAWQILLEDEERACTAGGGRPGRT